MTEPGDEIAVSAGDHSRLRALPADREQVIEVLKAAFVQGRLDRDEFGLRVGQALVARTRADLAALATDIPVGLAGSRPPEPARESVDKKTVVAVGWATAALLGMWPVTRMTAGGSPSALAPVLLTVILVITLPACWLALFGSAHHYQQAADPTAATPDRPASDGDDP